MNLDLRHPTDSGVQSLENDCRIIFEKIATENGIKLEFETIWVSPAVQFDPIAVGFVQDAVKEVGYETALISGAGHDRYVGFRKLIVVFIRREMFPPQWCL